jgi:hypothetical protein
MSVYFCSHHVPASFFFFVFIAPGVLFFDDHQHVQVVLLTLFALWMSLCNYHSEIVIVQYTAVLHSKYRRDSSKAKASSSRMRNFSIKLSPINFTVHDNSAQRGEGMLGVLQIAMASRGTS